MKKVVPQDVRLLNQIINQTRHQYSYFIIKTTNHEWKESGDWEKPRKDNGDWHLVTAVQTANSSKDVYHLKLFTAVPTVQLLLSCWTETQENYLT